MSRKKPPIGVEVAYDDASGKFAIYNDRGHCIAIPPNAQAFAHFLLGFAAGPDGALLKVRANAPAPTGTTRYRLPGSFGTRAKSEVADA